MPAGAIRRRISRRQFLKRSGWVAAGLTVTASAAWPAVRSVMNALPSLRDPETGDWNRSANLSGVLGLLHRLAAYRDGFWVAGRRGVAFATVDRAPMGFLAVGRDLPGVPLDLVVQGEFLWVGTEAGVVRWRLDAITP